MNVNVPGVLFCVTFVALLLTLGWGWRMGELQPAALQVIGPYRLLGRLGGGGMGQVFLGRRPGAGWWRSR